MVNNSKNIKTNYKSNNKNSALSNEENKQKMALSKTNITMLLAGFVVMCIGYLLLCGGGSSSDPSQFNAAALFSFRRLTLAPIVIFLGLCFEVYAIIHVFKK